MPIKTPHEISKDYYQFVDEFTQSDFEDEKLVGKEYVGTTACLNLYYFALFLQNCDRKTDNVNAELARKNMKRYDTKSPFLLDGNLSSDASHEVVQISWNDEQMQLAYDF